jgi:hypothetical protein
MKDINEVKNKDQILKEDEENKSNWLADEDNEPKY